jgi:hypothetical protein
VLRSALEGDLRPAREEEIARLSQRVEVIA